MYSTYIVVLLYVSTVPRKFNTTLYISIRGTVHVFSEIERERDRRKDFCFLKRVTRTSRTDAQVLYPISKTINE